MSNALTGYSSVQLTPLVDFTDLKFPNDVATLGDSPATMQTTVNRIALYGAKVDPKINTHETKAFSISLTLVAQQIPISGEGVDYVLSFKHLGSVLLLNGQAKNEVTKRAENASKKFLQVL